MSRSPETEALGVALRHRSRFPRWELDELVSELWLLSEELGLPPHVVWRRVHDRYERQTSHLPRGMRRYRERRGHHVPRHRSLDGLDFAEPPPDAEPPPLPEPLGDVAQLLARGLTPGQVARSLGWHANSVYRVISRLRTDPNFAPQEPEE